MLHLSTFGALSLESDPPGPPPLLRPQRLAVLAVLAVAGDRGISRERLCALFWPEVHEEKGRHSLRQLLYGLRQELGAEVVTTRGGSLSLDPALITSDLGQFRALLAAGDRAGAVAVARGPFLEGFYLPGAVDFERFVEEERGRLRTVVTAALLWLADDAQRGERRDDLVRWSRQLAEHEPLSGEFAAAYIRALASRGKRAEAMAFARQHEATVRRELDEEVDVVVLEAIEELRVRRSARNAEPSDESGEQHGSDSHRPTGAVDEMRASAPRSISRASRGSQLAWRGGAVGVAVAMVLLVASAAFARQLGWFHTKRAPTFAVGFIRDDRLPDTVNTTGVLEDMLATNLARVDGLRVLANTRLIELQGDGPDSSASRATAARRAGASELLEGVLYTAADRRLTLELRRVELESGVMKGVYRVSAANPYALVDSATLAIAHGFRLSSPGSSVSDATTESPVAYRFYEEGLRAIYQQDFASARRLMKAALDEDSTFAMAAYYDVTLNTQIGRLRDGRDLADLRRNALRLAQRAPERERLTITGDLLAQTNDPRALAVAESLTKRYPDDPRALMSLARVRVVSGDWAGAAAAMERAIAADSAAGLTTSERCRVCQHLAELQEVYLWWDSLTAAERTTRRFEGLHPEMAQPWFLLATIAARRGDSAAAFAYHRRHRQLGGGRDQRLRLLLTVGDYQGLEREVAPLLASSSKEEWSAGSWFLSIALRNEGRLREAWAFHKSGRLAGYDPPFAPPPTDGVTEAVLNLERGNARLAAERWLRRRTEETSDLARFSPSVVARHLTWNGTLQGMALAAAGDWPAVRALADSVERWGAGSAYGRDRRAHHYLRGLLHASAGDHAGAVEELRQAIHSPSLGFTRVNYELAGSLLALDRPREAVDVLRAALHGEVDASNLYLTRTDIHERMAIAFDAAGEPDSAASHYRAVVTAWRNADPQFQTRRAGAEAWLAASGKNTRH